MSVIENNLMPLLVKEKKSFFKAKCTIFLSGTDLISAWSEMDQEKSGIYTNFSWMKYNFSLFFMYFIYGASSRDEISELGNLTRLQSKTSQVQQWSLGGPRLENQEIE